jgi:hypothetical protein
MRVSSQVDEIRFSASEIMVMLREVHGRAARPIYGLAVATETKVRTCSNREAINRIESKQIEIC